MGVELFAKAWPPAGSARYGSGMGKHANGLPMDCGETTPYEIRTRGNLSRQFNAVGIGVDGFNLCPPVGVFCPEQGNARVVGDLKVVNGGGKLAVN